MKTFSIDRRDDSLSLVDQRSIISLGVCAHCLYEYQKRISGLLLGRIDIHIDVPCVDYEKLSGDHLGESRETIRKRVHTPSDVQRKRSSLKNSAFEEAKGSNG